MNPNCYIHLPLLRMYDLKWRRRCHKQVPFKDVSHTLAATNFPSSCGFSYKTFTQFSECLSTHPLSSQSVPYSCVGNPTGNGENLNSNQAEPGQAINSAVADLYSISFGASCARPRYYVCPLVWGIFWPLHSSMRTSYIEAPRAKSQSGVTSWRREGKGGRVNGTWLAPNHPSQPDVGWNKPLIKAWSPIAGDVSFTERGIRSDIEVLFISFF